MARQTSTLAVGAANFPAARLRIKILALIREGKREIAAADLHAHRSLFLGLLLADFEPRRTPALDPRVGQGLWQRLPRHLGPNHPPGAGHNAVEIIAAAAKGQPASPTIGLRKLVGQLNLR